jgi:ssDNA-binding Zn-finger/Zn-ribbon topoisomerase 1
MLNHNYGKEYVPASPREYHNRSKNAQEAHEAVRPTSASRTPAEVAKYVDRAQARLYELIWNRAIASQMESAELERTTVDIVAKAGSRNIEMRASGQVVKFDGFLTLYQEGQDETPDDDESRRLPAMSEGETLNKQAIESSQHFTEPPPRFSEAALVKRMEELGIGRPSTYASILQVLQDRGYVRIDKKRLIPEDKGRVVVAFLESFFTRYVEYDFTAGLEEKLDEISAGQIDWRAVLAEFWEQFVGAVNDIKEVRNRVVLDALNDLLEPHIFPERADGRPRRECPQCGNGQLSLKTGRFGAFVGCSNYPECNFTRQITPSADGVQGKKVLGEDPQTGLEVTLRGGRYGPYVQLGEQVKPPKVKKGEKKPEGEKPKRASIPKGVPDDINLERAPDRCRCRVKSACLLKTANQSLRARTLWSVFEAREPGRRRRCPDHRTQSRRHLNRRKESQPEERPPLRRRSRQDSGRTPRQRRPGCRQERPLWSLRQPQRHQRHHHRRQDARDNHVDRSCRSARCPRRAAELTAAPRRRPQEGGRTLGSPERPQEKGHRTFGQHRESSKAAQKAGEKTGQSHRR